MTGVQTCALPICFPVTIGGEVKVVVGVSVGVAVKVVVGVSVGVVFVLVFPSR